MANVTQKTAVYTLWLASAITQSAYEDSCAVTNCKPLLMLKAALLFTCMHASRQPAVLIGGPTQAHQVLHFHGHRPQQIILVVGTQGRKDIGSAAVQRFERLLLAADPDEGGDPRLACLAVLMDELLAPEQEFRPTMAQAHARLNECLDYLTA